MSATVLAVTENMPYTDWLEYRKQGIGGSDASVVCGISRYKSPMELWMEKTGRIEDTSSNEPAYWGTQLEPLVRSEFTSRTGIEIDHRMEILQSNENPFMLANLDGTCNIPESGICVFEAKTASAFKAAEWSDTIPDEYYLQLQHYMSVTGFAGAYIAVLIGGNTFRWQFIKRDEELISMLIKLESDFWHHVEDETPPPIDGTEASAHFLAETFPNSKKSQILLPPEAVDILEEYESACDKLNALTEDKKRAENKLKNMLGDNETGIIGNRIISWKSITQDRLDNKTLKAEHPTLYNKYLTQSSYRRFTVRKAN